MTSLPRRVFVTGANGFIGTRLRTMLADRGTEVSGVDLRGGAEVVTGDTTEPSTWAQHLHGVDAVVHTAAIVTFDGDRDEFWRVNVLGTRRVLDAAAAAGVPRVVVLSSVVVYGFEGEGEIDESRPIRPNGSPYVDTKIATEQVALQTYAAGELEVVVVRPGDVYGPGSPPWTLAPLAELRRGRRGIPRGGGLLNPIFVDDLVEGLVAACSRPDAAGQVLNLTAGAVPTRAYFRRLGEMVGTTPVELPAAVLRPAAGLLRRVDELRGRETHLSAFTIDYLARRLEVSNARARRVLGWEPRIDLDEGTRRTENWLRATGTI